eukprot:6214566-Pleurochrysis_carterae.AAC.4
MPFFASVSNSVGFRCLQAATAHLQTLNSKLVKARHSLHAANLKVESLRGECDKSRQAVLANDATIAALTEQEQALKVSYVERKLAYEKAHADKYSKQQQLKRLRTHKAAVAKEREAAINAVAAKRREWRKAHEEHMRADESAEAIGAKLEHVEKLKDECKKRAMQHKAELAKYSEMYDSLKRELDVIYASAAAVV